MADTLNQKKDMTSRRAPPRNEIVPQKLGEELRTKIDGLILDGDVSAMELGVIKSNINGLTTWSWIRDIFTILLLILIAGLIVWRGIAVEKHLQHCESIGALSPIQG